jgi:hypothetical protein
MHLPWLSIIFSILRSAIMDDVYPTIGSIKDLILSMSYLVDSLRVFQYIRHHYSSNCDAHRLCIERLPAKSSLMSVLALLHHLHDNSEIFLRTSRGTKLKLRGGGPPSCGPNKYAQATRLKSAHGAMALINHS